MALYFYRAISKEGKNVSGYLDTPTVQAARDQIKNMNLFLVSLDPAKEHTPVSFFARIFQRGVSLKDKIFFTKQLAVLLKAGIPLVQALDLLSEQTGGRLQNITIKLRDNIKEGGSFAGGLQLYPKVFGNIYIQLVKAGEAAGNLETILEKLTSYLERTNELNRKVRGALTMPIIQLVVIVLVVVALLYFVIPTIAKTLQGQGASLPWATSFLISISNLFINNFIVIAIVSVSLIVGFIVWSRTAGGSYLLDKIKLKIPILGFFSRMGAVVQFSNTLGMLLAAGVNLSDALKIVSSIVENQILREKLKSAEEKIIKQGKISQYLKETNLFPPVAIYLINTGEQSGELDNMLLSVASMYEVDLREYADGLSKKIGPIMLLIMAAIVGFVIVAVAVPIMNMPKLLEQGKVEKRARR